MKSIWNISLNVGNLTVPVKVYSTAKKSNPEFEMVDSRDLAGIKLLKYNSETGELVPNEFIGKAYRENGVLIPVSNELVKSCVPKSNDSLQFNEFLYSFDIPLIYHENFYILCPDSLIQGATMNYACLRNELFSANVVGLTNAVFRNLSCLFALSSNSQFLILHKLRYHEQIELPSIPELPRTVQLGADFMENFSNHINSHMIGFYNHTFKDDLTAHLLTKLRAKGENLKI